MTNENPTISGEFAENSLEAEIKALRAQVSELQTNLRIARSDVDKQNRYIAAMCAAHSTDEPETGYSDETVEYDGAEYLVYDDSESDEHVAEYIRESVWAFNADFLASETGLDASIFPPIQEQCESANPAILAMIESTCGLDSFIDSAVSADGRGHFVASYDFEEIEITVDNTEFFVYRTN